MNSVKMCFSRNLYELRRVEIIFIENNHEKKTCFLELIESNLNIHLNLHVHRTYIIIIIIFKILVSILCIN